MMQQVRPHPSTTKRLGAMLWVMGVLGIWCACMAGSAMAQSPPIPQSCAPATAESFLNANDVRAKMLNHGGLFWNGGAAVYEVPAGGGNHAVFAAGLWLGGYVDNELRVAGSTYGPFEFWPGPYEAVAAGEDCGMFDTIYEVSRRDLAALDSGGEPSPHVYNWPWQLGAPVVDGDGNPDNYDLDAGDRPRIYGDEMHWWVMNDIGNDHGYTETEPLGVEVQVLAFATAADGYEKTTFYHYTVINKSPDTIHDLQFGIFADTDLGTAFDDYVGSDSSLALGFSYNADNDDDGNYGIAPPAIGYQLTRTKGFGASLPNMTSFMYYNSGGGVAGDPTDASSIYGYLTSHWRDGLPLTLGGYGRDAGGTPVAYAFPGDPERREYWSEINSDGNGNAVSPADRRNVQSVGPTTLAPGDSIEVFVSIITAFGSDHLNSVTKLKEKAAELLNRSPESIPGSPAGMEPISGAPEILNVGPQAEQQPVSFDLRWYWGGPSVQFQVELTPTGHPQLTAVLYSWNTSISLLLDPNTMYSVRVRAVDHFLFGPWSEWVVFSTGESPRALTDPVQAIVIDANAAGPVNPPVMGAWSVGDHGFPTVGGLDRPPAESQTTGATWVLHTERSSENGDSVDYASFLNGSVRGPMSLVLRSDLEVRFTDACWSAWEEAQTVGEITVSHPTESGCYAYDRFRQFDGYSLQKVPFELWWSGRGTPDDPSDDVRLIAAGFDRDLDGWGMQQNDHPLSDGVDDPQTDRIRAFVPMNTSPGSTGHDDWLRTLISTCYESGSRCRQSEHLASTFRYLVFVNVDSDGSSPMPEAGTVFRVEVAQVPGPAPGAPSRGQVVQGNQPTFYWENQVFEADVLQIALDEGFEQVLFEVEGARSGEVVSPVLGAGTYYWRVSNELGTFSEPVPFFVATGVGSKDESGLPSVTTLESVFPNPFSDKATISFSLAEAGPVRVEMFDMLGRRVSTLSNRVMPAGQHTTYVEAGHLPSGMYVVRLSASGTTSARTLILTR